MNRRKRIMRALLVLFFLLLPVVAIAGPTPQQLCTVQQWHRIWKASRDAEEDAEAKEQNPIKLIEIKEKYAERISTIEKALNDMFGGIGKISIEDFDATIIGLYLSTTGSDVTGNVVDIVMTIPQCNGVRIIANFISPRLIRVNRLTSVKFPSDYDRFKPVLRELKNGDRINISGILFDRDEDDTTLTLQYIINSGHTAIFFTAIVFDLKIIH